MNNRHFSLRSLVGISTVAVVLLSGQPSIAIQPRANIGSATLFESLSAKPVNGIYPYKLKSNGLTVLIQEQHLAPVVSVMMVYGIGSRNEAVGYTGSTHFLEHLMFKGTAKHDPMKGTGIDDSLKPVGGINNATTSQDRTNYFEIAPAQNLNLLLDLESDRMRGLLLREDDRASEMTVVRNELERGEDDPDELLMSNLFAMSFREHPYHHPVIGWRADVEGVATSRLRQFYQDFYWPENATLIVIGDINKEETLKEIATKFGSIKRATKKLPAVYTQEPPQEGERRFLVQRGQDVPRMMMGFHTVAAKHADTYPLEVLQSILGDKGKTSSRLYRALVDNSLATDVYAYNNVMRDPGLFILGATPSKKIELEKVESALKDSIAEIAKTPPTKEELERAKLEIIKRYKLDATDSLGLADQIGDAIGVADWKWWANYPLGIAKVTPADVQAVAKKYLISSNMTVGFYKPKEDLKTAQESADAAVAGSDKKEIEVEPIESDEKTVEKGSIKLVSRAKGTGKLGEKTETLKFSNGLTVIVLPMPDSGTVTVAGKIKAGRYFEKSGQSKVPALTADLLTKGSRHYPKFKISEILESMGASLEFSADSFYSGFNSTVVKSDAKEIVALIADIIQNPLFERSELEKAKAILASDIEERTADTGAVAWNNMRHSLYKSDCVYFADTFANQLLALKKVKRTDLKTFHSKQFAPQNSVFSVVGDLTTDEVISLIQNEFGSWAKGEPETISISDNCADKAFEGKRIVANLADKTNTDVVIGYPVPLSIKSKDYFGAAIGMAALGYDSFACRLAPLRDKFGLTYSISTTLAEISYPNSLWAITYSVNPKNLEKAQGHIRRIVQEYLRDGIAKDELVREKGHLKGVYVVESRSPRAIASQLAYAAINDLPLNFLDNYAQRIDKENQISVNAAIRRYFNLDRCVTSIAGSVSPAKK